MSKVSAIAAAGRTELTLRDRFAMAALTGLLAGPSDGMPGFLEAVAKAAYFMADAMLAERSKKAVS